MELRWSGGEEGGGEACSFPRENELGEPEAEEAPTTLNFLTVSPHTPPSPSPPPSLTMSKPALALSASPEGSPPSFLFPLPMNDMESTAGVVVQAL